MGAIKILYDDGKRVLKQDDGLQDFFSELWALRLTIAQIYAWKCNSNVPELFKNHVVWKLPAMKVSQVT